MDINTLKIGWYQNRQAVRFHFLIKDFAYILQNDIMLNIYRHTFFKKRA